MTLVRWQPKGAMRAWSPFREIDQLQGEMGGLFDWAFGRSGGSLLTESGWAPPIDVLQDEDAFRVQVDLPGMKKEEIEITLDDNTLTIRGEKKRESETKEDDYYRTERFDGTFSRSLVLPSATDANKIEATYRDGVLDVVIPKSEEAKPKQIKIQS